MMERTNYNNILINKLLEKMEHEKKLFSDEFQKNMGIVSIHTLLNINFIIEDYLNSYQEKNSDGKKLILIFGLLQGLFAGIDSLYSIGKALNLNKVLINLNQNKIIKEIKRIRNDVVGHPSYRYYDDKSIGYCLMDVDHITSSKIVYQCYSKEKNFMETIKKEVDMVEVIDNYYIECNNIIINTIKYVEIKSSLPIVNLLSEVLNVFTNYQKEIKDFKTLENIKNVYSNLMGLSENTNDRILWRINNIFYMFSLEKNEFVDHLTNLEIKKLYELVFVLEKQINNEAKRTRLYFYGSDLLNKLKRKLRKFEKYNKDIYTDNDNPLFDKLIKDLINISKEDSKYLSFSKWLESIFTKNDNIMLYAIGSFLKAN